MPKNPNPTYRPNLAICLAGLLCFTVFAFYYECWPRTLAHDVDVNEKEFLDSAFGSFMEPHVNENSIVLSENEALHIDSAGSDGARDLYNDLYSGRQEAYEAGRDNLNLILDMILVMMVLGLFVLFYQPGEVEVPVVRFMLPDKLFYLVVPLGIVYLFFRLGLTMNASIDSRLVLEIMTDHRETIGDQQIAYYYSNARNFVDQGLVDAWCAWFHDIFEQGRGGKVGNVNAFGILFIWFGTFLGLMQGVCLCLVSLYHEKFRHSIFSFLLWLTTNGGFVMWSLSLVYMYHHSAFFVAWQWLVTLAAIVAWQKRGRLIAEKLSAKKNSPKAG